MVKELETLHREQKDRDRHSSTYQEVQARGFTEKIDSMTAQLLNKDEALTQKSKEITQLIENIKKLELENEAITILKAQVILLQCIIKSGASQKKHSSIIKNGLSNPILTWDLEIMIMV